MLQERKDYRVILKEELAARCRHNSRYSLRAFARDLKISPSRLSEVLNGKQGLSRDAAEKLADKLGYVSSERERFCDLVESEHARSQKDRELAKIRLRKYAVATDWHRLKEDAFRAISDWYHLAILELIDTKTFQENPRWIAKQLTISEIEVELAIDRLLRLDLLKRTDGKLTPGQGDGVITGDIPSESIKRFHQQVLKKASDALYVQNIGQREFSTQIMAVDKSKLNQARQSIREFQHRFCKDQSQRDAKDGVYCLSIQFFDIAEGGAS